MTRFSVFVILSLLCLPLAAISADSGYIEVNAPTNRQLKLAVIQPQASEAPASPEIAKSASEVMIFDMNMSGTVAAEVRPPQGSIRSLLLADVDFTSWQKAGFDMIIQGEYSLKGRNLTVEFRLYDTINRKLITSRRYFGTAEEIRRFSHSFCDEILLVITGEKGVFNTRIAYVSSRSGNKEIYLMDWDGYNPQPVTRNGSINLNPDFSPDGREIIFTSYKRGKPDLYRRPLSSQNEIPISYSKGLNITGNWSPDGNRIALSLSKDGDAEIYTVDREGGKPNRLTVNPALDLYPSWSPDGRHIAFVSDRLGKPQIFVMNSDGGNTRRVTASGNYNVNPRWSPKGDKIVYSRMTPGGFNIFTIAPDGSGDTQLTFEGNNENPAWSPDGRFICFSSKRGGESGIYVMRADGTGQIRVSVDKGPNFQPAWSPRK